MIYYFDLAGKLQGSAYLATFSKMVGKPIKTVEACLKGFRGYSYLGGYYISSSPEIKLMSVREAERLLSKWVSTEMPARIKVLQRRYSSFQEELVSEVLLYMFRAVKRPQGINDFSPLFDWKYNLVLCRHISKENKTALPLADVEICPLLGGFSEIEWDSITEDEISRIKALLSDTLDEQELEIFMECLPHLEYNGGQPTYSVRTLARRLTHPSIACLKRGKGEVADRVLQKAFKKLF